jgi:hypothetical protein
MQEEIITLQFGSFSNIQLEKWWNLEVNNLTNHITSETKCLEIP